MTGLGVFKRTDAERAEQSARHSAARVASHERRRNEAVAEVAKWPIGVTPMAGLSEAILQALVSRGLAEKRYVLTAAGRRLAETLAAQS